METLTIFTPAYNRADLLPRCYEALKRQTSKDFVWIIIDDGSTDNTKELCENWVNTEKDFRIFYYYKENGGLHTAYNMAIEKMYTELAVCIDSDDYMPDNAVELILDFWKKNGSDEYAGITGLDYNAKDGTNIGGFYPDNQKSINLIDVLAGRYPDIWGDKKHVVRTSLYKEVAPMPSFDNEKNFNPHCMHLEISKKYDFLILNENLCFVDYQEDGMSRGIYRQFENSPQSFAQIRRIYMMLPNVPKTFIFRQCIHYTSSCIIAKRFRDIISKSPKKVTTFFALPFGVLLSLYVKWKAKQ